GGCSADPQSYRPKGRPDGTESSSRYPQRALRQILLHELLAGIPGVPHFLALLGGVFLFAQVNTVANTIAVGNSAVMPRCGFVVLVHSAVMIAIPAVLAYF